MAFKRGESGNAAAQAAPGDVKNPGGRPVSFRTISAGVAKRVRRSAMPITEVCISKALDGSPECAAAIVNMMAVAELVQALSKTSTRD
ncbi:hypothetical protein EVC45_42015 [Paraburkholderia sp. UYCP14C]|uniref:hypothetical protein n=1 Tax=Paraburkholderia sp. UYCP14C TaxID=2511130 RepID=UPI001021A52C|nr:hypothetical protein [Paraburkholderia sp. UYCP14C]RZF23846.1 hypothetical protein EVC45_42015 [Paraburkholderia sp. UYCP14C]